MAGGRRPGSGTRRAIADALAPESPVPPPPAPGNRTLSVVDCGTTSVRAYLVELRADGHRILEDLTYPVDLGASFTGGRLTRADMDGVVAALEAVVAAAKGYGISEIRAVGTSGLREAANADVLLERLRTRLGIELDVIDAAEEARLYVEALRSLLRSVAGAPAALDGTTLLVEIGGGGSCTGLIRDGKLVHSVDEHYGTHRLYDQFQHLRDSVDFAVSIDRYAKGAARIMLSRLPVKGLDRLVVTGGVVRRLATLTKAVPASAGNEALQRLDPAAVDRFWEDMQGLTPPARAQRCGCSEDVLQAAVLLPAASLVRHLTRLSGAKDILVPRLTLRDGLLADLAPGAQGPHHLDHADLIAEARQLVARYGGDTAYAENTAALAVQIFDQTKALHGLDGRERTLLEFSALVHDIGSYINVRNRHKHTMYIIQSSDIAGLTRMEQEMVANIARYHRKSPPEAHHEAFQALPRAQRVVVGHLAAILRLAYALDVERDQRIRSLRCEVAGDRLLLHVDRRQIALERWSMASKAGMFHDIFGLRVEVMSRAEG